MTPREEFYFMNEKSVSMLTPEKQQEKKLLTIDCVKISLLLILYNLLNRVFAVVFFYVAYTYHSGKFTLSYSTALNYLRKQTAFINSTSFSMTANLFITLMSVIIFGIIFAVLFRKRAKSFVKPKKNTAVKGLIWFPACFVINILLSQLVSILTGILGQNGVTVPSSDFSIHQPSVLAIAMQFSYVVIIAPIVEEFIYRGAILTALNPYGKGVAVLFSALAFGLMHGNIPQAASAFGTGLVYAIIAAKCGSILPTVIIHCLNNLIANFSSISEAIGLEHYETFLSIAEIIIGLVGFMVLFTSLKKLIIDDSENVLTPKECRRYVFTNPATLIYMLCLIVPIVKSLIQANS